MIDIEPNLIQALSFVMMGFWLGFVRPWKFFHRPLRKKEDREEGYDDVIRIPPSAIKFSIKVKTHTHPEIRALNEDEYAIEV